MTPGQLVKAVSLALDVPEETVVQHDRNLVVAGLRTKGGRGRSAPEVTSLDAARLITACLASVRTKDSVLTVRAFEQAQRRPKFVSRSARDGGRLTKREEDQIATEKELFDLPFMKLPVNHSFVEALASLITEATELFDAGKLEQLKQRFALLSFVCFPGGVATITRKLASIQYENPARNEHLVPDGRPEPKTLADAMLHATGMSQTTTIRGVVIVLLGRAFRESGLNFRNAKAAIADIVGWRPKKELRGRGESAA